MWTNYVLKTSEILSMKSHKNIWIIYGYNLFFIIGIHTTLFTSNILLIRIITRKRHRQKYKEMKIILPNPQYIVPTISGTIFQRCTTLLSRTSTVPTVLLWRRQTVSQKIRNFTRLENIHLQIVSGSLFICEQ